MGTHNNDFSAFLDDDPQPVDDLPPAGQGISPGRKQNPRYVALQARLMIRPGVDHLITVLPAADHRQTAKSRKVASGLRSTLKRYNVTLTERKIDEQIKVYGRYENGATETI